MLEKEDKDGTIAFLKERLQQVQSIVNSCAKKCTCANDRYENCDCIDAAKSSFHEISDLIDKTLIDVTW